MLDRGIAQRNEAGRAQRLVGATRDVTELKRREQELAEAHDRFSDAIEALSSGFVLFDRDDRVVVCNRKYREYFPELEDMVVPGTPFADIIAAGLQRGLFPKAAEDPKGWMAALLARRAETAGVREQHMENGLWLQVSDHRTKDGGIVSIYTDVTELKSREAELRAQSAVLEATLENMDQAISMVDPDLKVVNFNSKFLDFMEFPLEQFKPGFSRGAGLPLQTPSAANTVKAMWKNRCASAWNWRRSFRRIASNAPSRTAPPWRSSATRSRAAASSRPTRISPSASKPNRSCANARRS